MILGKGVQTPETTIERVPCEICEMLEEGHVHREVTGKILYHCRRCNRYWYCGNTHFHLWQEETKESFEAWRRDYANPIVDYQDYD